MNLPAPPFAHLDALTDGNGIFEHAEYAEPRRKGGYCTDDASRLLVVCCREPKQTEVVQRLTHNALQFLVEAQSHDGTFRNRRTRRGRWSDRPTTSDWWGRSLWALGTATNSHDPWVRQTADYCFARGARRRSPWSRSMAFAALGAAELLRHDPERRDARMLITDALGVIGGPAPDPSWPWPEARLSYANAVLPEAMIASGVALDRSEVVRDGLGLLAWLLDHESGPDHLSMTPIGGAGPGDVGPRFDQQPIEVAALADACARAATVDDDPRWPRAVEACAQWFLGANDGGVPMWDPATGGGYDGLQRDSANQNEGAESTIALTSTLQQAHRLLLLAP
jgi:hypothetical protein